MAPKVAALLPTTPGESSGAGKEKEWHHIAAAAYGYYTKPWYFGAVSREVCGALPRWHTPIYACVLLYDPPASPGRQPPRNVNPLPLLNHFILGCRPACDLV